MLSLAGEVFAKLAWIGSRLSKINAFIQFFFAHGWENATSYYNLLDILKFDNIFKLKVALFAHKIINDPTGIPTIFSGTLPLAFGCHRNYTRFFKNLNFHRPQIYDNYGASTFSFIALKYRRLFHWSIKKLCYYRFSKHFKLFSWGRGPNEPLTPRPWGREE